MNMLSTGLHPHISVAADKSTPHRDTNHAILVLLPVNSISLVYSISRETNEIKGGSGHDLAKQVVTVLRNKLDFGQNDMNYVRGTVC